MNQVGRRIVVLDRSRTIQILLAHYFRNAGHHVITCTTPQEALALLPTLHEVPDVLFLEIDYEKEAYQVMRYVKEQGADTQATLVAMILQEEKAEIERALKEPNVHYLVKPFQIQQALALVSTSIPAIASSEIYARERKKQA